jgi:hypothetical protein
VHRLHERANVLTRRITLESQAHQDADARRIPDEVSREPELATDLLGLTERPAAIPRTT